MSGIIMYIGNETSLLGSIGKITSQPRNGTINIRVLPHLINSKIDKIYEIIKKYQPNQSNDAQNNPTSLMLQDQPKQRWYSLPDAAELLNVQKIVLKRILEHIFVIHGNEKIQIGLKLFNFKKRLVVSGHTRIAKKYAESYIDS